ncbi:MAG: glycosyltransferase family 2 protein [Bacteroidota bacterium]
MPPKISIVIPVKNGAGTIRDCLNGIKNQTLYCETEVIVIDSGSTDATLSIIGNYNVNLHQIEPEKFNHGRTRNLGVKFARGEFVAMTVQDAVPNDNRWLEKMLVHFEDKEVMGVCGQQIVPRKKDTNPHQWFRPVSKPKSKIVQFHSEEFISLSGKDQRKFCGWDDVTAMYRKSALLELPFDELIFGEDMLWAKKALIRGYKLVYEPLARVNHYHHHSPNYTYERTMIVWLFIYLAFGFIREQPYRRSAYFLVLVRNFRWCLHPKWILHNWSIIKNVRRAVKDFNKIVSDKNVEHLELKFALKIPQGSNK